MAIRLIQALGIAGLTLFGFRGVLPDLSWAAILLMLASVGAALGVVFYMTDDREPRRVPPEAAQERLRPV
jgi:hypothetical protein